MRLDQSEILRTFKGSKIVFAIALGLLGTGYLFYLQIQNTDVDNLWQELREPNWSWALAAIMVLFVRDLGYIYRIRNLTQHELTWKGSVYTILLWEFASAITPSVVGGTAVAVFILNKEGIRFGKSLAYVILTAILDNSFFLVAAPLVLYFTPGEIFPVIDFGSKFSMEYLFIISYSLIAIYTGFMMFSVLFAPHAFRNGLVLFVSAMYRLTGLRLLIKLRILVKEYYRDIITASLELKGKGSLYWVRAISSTIFIWSARYFTLNCIMAVFSKENSFAQHLDIFSKQIILWITQLVSPTPGGSGFAEFFLEKIFGGGAIIIAIALIWRLLTYYSYLILGSIVLPKWLRRVFIRLDDKPIT